VLSRALDAHPTEMNTVHATVSSEEPSCPVLTTDDVCTEVQASKLRGLSEQEQVQRGGTTSSTLAKETASAQLEGSLAPPDDED